MNGPIDQHLRRKQLENFAALLAEKRRRIERDLHKTRGHYDADGKWAGGLLAFTRYFWHIIEPGRKMVNGWPLEAIAQHLEAVYYGEVQHLLITVPPGCMKSLLTDVFFPAWIWSIGNPDKRFVAFSYSASLTERDNGRFRDLLQHPDFKAIYGDVFTLRKVGETKVTNNHHGWKLATSVGGVGTGERGDYLLCDDLHNVKEGESEQVRTETTRWFREALSDRLNDIDKGAIIVIMQRVHEDDVAGTIITEEFDYCHLCIQMQFVWDADDEGNPRPTEIGWVDPRWTEDPEECDGELMWPERFPPNAIDRLEKEKGPYAWAAQYQQTPEPRGGGILKREFWQPWPTGKKFPAFSYVFASLDGAFTEDEQNDPSALTIWGVFENEEKYPRVMLIFAWEKYLAFEGQKLQPDRGENQRDFMERQMREWGLVEWTAHTMKHWKCDRLLIEAKANGISAAQSLEARYRSRNWSVQLEPVKGDKTARMIGVQPTFSQKMVYAPTEREWCKKVIDQCAVAPLGKHDDLCDTVTQAIKHCRDCGLLEYDEDIRAGKLADARLEVQKFKDGNRIANYMPGTT